MRGLEECRKKAGLSQAALAAAIGAGQSSVSAWESGTSYPSADKLPVIADTLGCTIDALFGRTKS